MASSHSPVSHSMDSRVLELPGVVIELPFGLTRFMLAELLVAVVICLIFIPLARHIASTPVTRGRFRNMLEAIILFVREKIVYQGMHGHVAERLLPFFLSLFFFILFNNLLGQIPGGATATADINVSGMLAALIFVMVLWFGVEKSGLVGFWINLVPKLDLPIFIKAPLWVLLFFVELFAFFIKHGVLAVRLFANMFAGHTVQAVVLGFIAGATGWLGLLIATVSIAGSLALVALELLVACLQAFIFCLLASLFIGAAADPHH